MPPEELVNSPGLNARLKHKSVHHGRPMVTLEKGACQYSHCSLEFINKEMGKKIYITSWGKIKAELVSELNQCAALLGYLFQK